MNLFFRNNFRFILMLMALGIFFSFSGCKKSPDSPDHPKTMDDLKVPSTFNWETSHEVFLAIAVDLPGSIGSLSKISIYDGNPLENGNLLIAGSAGYNYPFITALRIPTALKQIFMEMKTVAGITRLIAVNVEENIQYTFSETKSGYKNAVNVTEPDCSSGCTVTLSGSGSTTMTGGKTYCITGTYTGIIISGTGGGTLRVCGSAVLTLLKVNTAGCNIIVTSGGHLTLDSLYMSSTSTLSLIHI